MAKLTNYSTGVHIITDFPNTSYANRYPSVVYAYSPLTCVNIFISLVLSICAEYIWQKWEHKFRNLQQHTTQMLTKLTTNHHHHHELACYGYNVKTAPSIFLWDIPNKNARIIYFCLYFVSISHPRHH